MKKSNVYTRSGDAGQTSLVGGKRVSKASLRLDSYGTVDELNSQIGLLLTDVEDEEIRAELVHIQCQLFSAGAMLATPPEAEKPSAFQLKPADIEWTERAIDRLDSGLPGWRGFTLPGGCRAAAEAHVCRTVCRRAERVIWELKNQEPVADVLLQYLNRLSDYLYVLSCRLNFMAGVQEILWRKSSVNEKK